MPMNRVQYHPDWESISRQIREQAGWCCEGSPRYPDCRAVNGEPHPETGSRVVLTVAHMGLPMQIPFHLHVTRATKAGEVIKLVGFGMPLHTESLEWNNVVHDRSIAEFARGTTAPGTPFVIALPSIAPGLAPRGAVIPPPTTSPIWVLLTSWSLRREPLETAIIVTETPPTSQVVSTNLVLSPAPLTSAGSKAPLRPTKFDESTFIGTSLPPACGLRNGQRENITTDHTSFFYFAATGRTANARGLLPSAPHATGFAETDARTRLAQSIVGCRCWEYLPTDYTGLFEGANAWTTHTTSILYHVVDNKMNNDPANLRALCQRCHLDWDLDHHMSNARRTRAERKRGAALPLPLEVNPQ